MSKWLFSFFFLFVFFSCADTDAEQKEGTTVPSVEEKPNKLETVFETNIDFLRLRETKGKGGNVIKMLSEKTVLKATGEVSMERSEEVLRGIRFNEPWVQVKTEDGKIGWAYGGALKIIQGRTGEIGKKLLRMRLVYFFGEELGQKIYHFKKDFEKKQTSNEFAALYKESSGIVAAANKVLNKKALIDENNPLPDLSWIVNRLPGHIVHQLSQNGSYQLFRDYKVFANKSKKTLGKIDDAFFNLCLEIFDVDSIEYILPGWQMDVPKIGVVSLLGKGIHYSVLRKMNVIMNGDNIFEKEINTFKVFLMEDLVNEKTIYWYSKDKILKELDSLIDSEFGILTKNDLIALKTRRDIIAKAEGESIMMNLRAGL